MIRWIVFRPGITKMGVKSQLPTHQVSLKQLLSLAQVILGPLRTEEEQSWVAFRKTQLKFIYGSTVPKFAVNVHIWSFIELIKNIEWKGKNTWLNLHSNKLPQSGTTVTGFKNRTEILTLSEQFSVVNTFRHNLTLVLLCIALMCPSRLTGR